MFATADLSHARGPAGVVFPRRRLACFFPLFRPGALPIELARGGFPDRLCWPAPSARPLQRTVDQTASRSTGPTISMMVSKDIDWMDSSTAFLRGWCDLRPP